MAAAMSALLILLILAGAIRSFWGIDLVHLRTPGRWTYFWVGRTHVSFGSWPRGEHDFSPRNEPNPEALLEGDAVLFRVIRVDWDRMKELHSISALNSRSSLHFAGFWLNQGASSIPSLVEIVIPHWMLLVLLLVAPVGWLIGRVKRRRRVQEGCCRQCGYDLRATPDRCPECGTSVATVI
jgi:hypothetical protein